MLISRRTFLAAASSAGFVGRCGSGGNPPPGPPPPPSPPPPGSITFDFTFADNLAGWEPGYSDYAPGQEAAIDFAFGHERLPPPLSDRSGLYLASRNVSDDVFMYAARLLDGLRPDTRYAVRPSLEIATDAPPGCFGIGGAPGESVTVKAGASRVPPQRRLVQGRIEINVDKGDQSEGGADLAVLGNLAQATAGGDCLSPVYQRKSLATAGQGTVARSDSAGRLWLIFGTDSGYEGLTRIYVLQGRFILTPT